MWNKIACARIKSKRTTNREQYNRNEINAKKNQFLGLLEEIYDPRQQALKLVKSMVRIRTQYTFPKVLKFSEQIISDAHKMQGAYYQERSNNNNNSNDNSNNNSNNASIQNSPNGANNNNNTNSNGNYQISDSQMLEMMIKKEGVLAILGTLSGVLEKADEENKNHTYMNAMKSLIMSHVIPDFRSQFGFLCARACWVVLNYYKLEYDDNNVYRAIAQGCIQCLQHPELPVKIESSRAIARIILNDRSFVLFYIIFDSFYTCILFLI